LGTGVYGDRQDSGAGQFTSNWFEVRYRPTSSLYMTLEPAWRRSDREMQYVRTLAFDGESRFVFGTLDQETLSLELRIDYAITPNLTVQFYGEPFASRGRYSEFKRITDPRAGGYRDRWSPYSSGQVAFDSDAGTYQLDEDLDGVSEASFSNPDFDFRALNSNLVVRWEFSPGSTLFVVWSESRLDTESLPGGLGFQRDIDQLFTAEPTDVFLVKIRKWFSP
jgi:hypothetical protein